MNGKGIVAFSARIGLVTATLAVLPATASAGVHLWKIQEVFSDPSGTIQFVEVCAGPDSSGEWYVGGHSLTSGSHSYTVTSNVSGNTYNKTILFATAGFAALPGAPTPDHIIADNFFSTSGDTISFIDSRSFGSGVLPTNGIDSLNFTSGGYTTGANSPRNYAEDSGSVNAAPLPPVPDGGPGESPVTVTSLDPTGTSVSIAFDTAACGSTDFRNILYGQASGFPSAGSPTFSLLGAKCSIGQASPYVWNPTPDATDGSGLVFWVIVTSDGSKEGSWGRSSGGVERPGPGTNGASDLCGSFDKSIANSCGQ